MTKKGKDNSLILFKTEDDKVTIDVRFDDDTVWLSQLEISELYNTAVSNVLEHIKNIYKDSELNEDSTIRKFRIVRIEGTREVEREILHYNLDMIISIGYRVNSKRATQFRQWATKRLNEYIRKGFTLDDERLKNGGGRYFKELLQRIRDIRSSERNLWQQITDIYATSVDYNKSSDITREFFATVQNKMHYAVHKQTAAEVIYNRVDNQKPLIGMTNFKGNYITKEDVKIAKNYLSENELQKLNLLTENFLSYAEIQAIYEKPMSMNDWKVYLDNQLKQLNVEVLVGKGKISKKTADDKAVKELEIYRQREMKQLKSDFDIAVKMLIQKNNKDENE
jgi:hypothetical protein